MPGIGDDVHDHLFHTDLVQANIGEIRGEVFHDLDIMDQELVADQGQDPLNRLGQINALVFVPRGLPAVKPHVGDNGRHPVDLLDKGGQMIIKEFLLTETVPFLVNDNLLGNHLDDIEGLIQFMGNPGGHLTQGGKFFALYHADSCLPKVSVGLFQFGGPFPDHFFKSIMGRLQRDFILI